MVLCAYCDNERAPTREHVVPNWYAEVVGKDGLETFNARKPTTHTLGDIVIRDVCGRCNNGPLGRLDAFAKLMYQDCMKSPVFYGESVNFDVDRDQLIRWLLKVCFNSGRVHNSDVDVLREYRKFILGEAPCPGDVALYAHLVTPTDFRTDPPTAARRVIGDNEVYAPQWFRLTQFRSEPDHLTEVVQRQIYIDAMCFTLFVCDPRRTDHSDDLQQIRGRFEQEYMPPARMIVADGPVTLTAGEVHAVPTLGPHMSNYPSRYTDEPASPIPEFAEMMQGLVDGTCHALAIQVTREEFESGDISHVAGVLADLVRSREAAMSSMQRVAIFTDVFDDDERPLWEIPEARNYLRRLFKACPFIFFLAAPDAKTVELLAACWCDVVRDENNRIDFDMARVREFLDVGFAGLNEVTSRFAISVETNRQISNDILAVFHLGDFETDTDSPAE